MSGVERKIYKKRGAWDITNIVACVLASPSYWVSSFVSFRLMKYL
jgi:hypothetical protein